MRTAIFSTFPPRACGIGTFSSDLRDALLEVPDVEDVRPVVVVDEPSSPQRDEVLATVSQFVRGDYTRAARLLSHMDVDVVLLQHEFGIFGGVDGDYVVSFARDVAQPLVVTLHTLLSDPSGHQLEVLTALCDRAERVIVMTDTAQRVLVGLGACSAEKVRVVPHGAPTVLARRRDELAAGSGPRNCFAANTVRTTLPTGLQTAGCETASPAGDRGVAAIVTAPVQRMFRDTLRRRHPPSVARSANSSSRTSRLTGGCGGV